MATREIPRKEWEGFFNTFSQQHAGWLVTIEILDANLGTQIQAQDWPLVGISTTTNPKDGHTGIAIDIGTTGDAHLTHMIENPMHVKVTQLDHGADEALEIESRDAGRTLVRFRLAMPSEMLNGGVKVKGTN